MLDHIGIYVHSYERSKAFYRLALAPLGYELILEYAGWGGFGWADKPVFWIKGGKSTAPGLHIAFRAEDRETVREFHRVALEAGGKDKGAPGLREEYHPDYYAAYVLDPDGHNVEVVCHTPGDLEV
ncbi:VOC family protein [Microbulbifer thermotolerans]|uniref:Glyoxalase n=1 Tax=Microbulbifer thermotolerans TaxID=252514 RepID=A0A143HIU5_MICTH|nr:VOC family protein [Microbulbifer thermotolerans]AMX01427.1 glyoxalase [Microbulbifer thermotolerans]MCX2782013.1 VOC family protein [Microbulbifer thermotolerans]MCX2783229.1 VOC family protein [Microbulbifer thermotolerans]MCX2795598.1 VOC family protein [Microbulbifer thermotolerans]MCX2800311.1 VOC family protein [Microbulbifer thermotolerans]